MKLVMLAIAAAVVLGPACSRAANAPAGPAKAPDHCLLENGGYYNQAARSWMLPVRDTPALFGCRQNERARPDYAENPQPSGAPRPPDQCLIESGGYYDQAHRTWMVPFRNTPALFACRQRRRQDG